MRFLLRGGAARAIVARGVSILASFSLTIVVARVLDLERAGVFFLVLSAVAVAATFGRFGTDTLAMKVVDGATARARRDVLHILRIAAIASVVAAAIGLVLALLAKGALPGASPTALIVAASAVIPQALAVIAGAILRARGRLAAGTFAELGSMPVLTAAGTGVGVFTGSSSLDWALGSLAVASWLTAAWSVVAARASLRGEPAPADSVAGEAFGAFVGRNRRGLTAMMGTALIFYVIVWVPVFVLSAAGDFEAVSQYSAAARLVGFVTLIPAVQVSYLAPLFARLYREGDRGGLSVSAGTSALLALAISLVPGLVLILAGGFALELAYGPDYAGAHAALAVLAGAALVATAAGQVNQLMLLCDLEWAAFALNAALLCILAAVGWLVAREFGLLGVAILSGATTVAYSVASVVLLRVRAGISSVVRLPRRRS